LHHQRIRRFLAGSLPNEAAPNFDLFPPELITSIRELLTDIQTKIDDIPSWREPQPYTGTRISLDDE
jgi:hypothetical protein